jgi:hypothetical protein
MLVSNFFPSWTHYILCCMMYSVVYVCFAIQQFHYMKGLGVVIIVMLFWKYMCYIVIFLSGV